MFHRPLLLGHRGMRSSAPPAENSIAAFEYALNAGCDGFEFDVRRTADGHAVICHDPQHNGCELASARRSQLPDLALLEDVLAQFSHRAFLDIELKESGLEEETLSLLRRHSPQRGYTISSFLPDVLTTLRGADDNVSLGLICERHSQLERWRELPVNYVIPHHAILSAPLLEQLRSDGKKVIVWTVNSPRDMRRFWEWGVDGLVSDNPGLLSRTLATSDR
jgi:glycerophosphoryl diester phosphodiesterase